LIKFVPPDDKARRKIWTVMTGQFGLAVDARLLDALVGAFPATSGRDIKGLAKLVAKYCHHRKVLPILEVFERCAIFRGIDPSPPITD
jgi:AAA+ superfamily predicted ATPase